MITRFIFLLYVLQKINLTFFFTFSVCLCPTDSCDKVTCPGGKYCLQDQNLMPHCVKCATYCPPGMTPSKLVCGSDGRTYQSACHLREAACRVGKAIPIAYKGRCKSEYSRNRDHLLLIELIIVTIRILFRLIDLVQVDSHFVYSKLHHCIS